MPKQPRRKRQGRPSTSGSPRKPQTSKTEPRKITFIPAQPESGTTSDSSTSRSTASRASARREERRAQRQEQDQRKKFLQIGGAVLAVAVVIGLFFGVSRWMLGPDVSDDVATYFGTDEVGVAVHPEDDTVILYEQVPPVGGPHNGIWQTCGFYDEYIFNWHGVHSLEHGAVWLTYDPELPQEDIEALADKANQGYVLVSPYPGLDAPVVGSVWGKQIEFTGVDDDRIDAFINQYRLNPDNTPEPGARCTGGVTLTTDQVPQQTPYQQVDPNAAPIGGLTSIAATATAEAPAPAATPESTPVSSPEARNEDDEAIVS